MLEQAFRHQYQYWLVDPVATLIHKHIQPMHITLLSGLTGILIIPAMMYQQAALSVLLLLLSGYLDTLDGTVARAAKKTSAFGTVADIMTDRVVEFAAIFGLWLANPDGRALVCLLMLGTILCCITSFLVVGIFTPNHSNKGFHYSPGIIERAEAFIFFGLMMVMPNYFNVLGGVFITLVLLTTMVRLYEFRRNTL